MLVDDKPRTFNPQAREWVKERRRKVALERRALVERIKRCGTLDETCQSYRELPVAVHRRSIKSIIAETAEKHGVRPEDIIGTTIKASVVAARHEAMWRARRERTDLSLPALGKLFGGRDHSTVLKAINKMAALYTRGTA